MRTRTIPGGQATQRPPRAPATSRAPVRPSANLDRIPSVSSQHVSIVVPTYREAANIAPLTERIFRTLETASLSGELIVVDDHSNDGTREAVERLAANYPIRLIERIDERGLSSAVVRGFDEARHDILVCMDADLSHPPESLPDIIGPIADGASEFCIGSRYVAGGGTEDRWGLLRRLNSRGATLLARPLTAVADPMAGFFCLRRDTYERAKAAGLRPTGYKIGLELLIKARCQDVAERPIAFADRAHGESKLTFGQQVLYLRHLARLYRFRWPIAAPLATLGLIGLGIVAVVLAIGLFRSP